MPGLDVSNMDFFKTVVDGQPAGMEDASPNVEVLKDVATNNPTPEAQEDKNNDI